MNRRMSLAAIGQYCIVELMPLVLANQWADTELVHQLREDLARVKEQMAVTEEECTRQVQLVEEHRQNGMAWYQ